MPVKKKKRVTKPGRRIAGKGDRLLMVITLARKHIKDDLEFVQEINRILVQEKILKEEEFGSLEKFDEEID